MVVSFLFAALVAVSSEPAALWAGFGLAVLLAGLAKLPLHGVFRRLGAANVFVLTVFLILPATYGGRALFYLGPVPVSEVGLFRAATIALKCNAIVLGFMALVSTMELSTLGHAFSHLYVPDKLTHLFLMTLRYLDVLRREYLRMARAMKVRCFRPRMNRHTYRSLAYLAGMLLVRSFDRSERVAAAMKCRGFRGRFYLLDHFAFGAADAVFGAATAAALLVMGWMEWK